MTNTSSIRTTSRETAGLLDHQTTLDFCLWKNIRYPRTQKFTVQKYSQKHELIRKKHYKITTYKGILQS